MLAHSQAKARGPHRRFRSGKSSLAFDTLYAEGHDATSSHYLRMLGSLANGETQVRTIRGLSPTISIEQKRRLEILDPRWGRLPKYRTPESPLCTDANIVIVVAMKSLVRPQKKLCTSS